jgi:hypothetical protein
MFFKFLFLNYIRIFLNYMGKTETVVKPDSFHVHYFGRDEIYKISK